MNENVVRTRLLWVAGAYSAVVAISAALIFARYVAYMRHPDDAVAAGGMWAGGDLMLELFIAGMLLVVTFFLVLVIFRDEAAYLTYSKILVGFSLTAPLSIGLIAVPAVGQSSSMLGYVCFYRALDSPLVLMALAVSRLFARFPGSKRMTTYALLIEGLTLVAAVLVLFSPLRLHRG